MDQLVAVTGEATADERVGDMAPASPIPADSPPPAAPRAKGAGKKAGNKKAKQFWLKQLHAWHWISAAVSLTAMFLFSITGITLNHASTIGAEPSVVTADSTLPTPLLAQLTEDEGSTAPLPAAVEDELERLVGIDAHGKPAEWSADEVYVAVPGPGSDAWISVDRASGAVTAEATDRGFISFINDLHKGRNTGTAWFWFIDVLSVACVIFTFTGLLLLQLHARNRPSTWPLVGLGTALPLIIIIFFLHI